MSTPTTNYGFLLPAVNSPTDADLWGGELNANISEQDALFLTAINWVTSAPTTSFSVTASTAGSGTTGSAKNAFLCNATSGAIVPTLPAASACGNGFTVAFKKTDSSVNAVTITPTGSDKIDGASTYVLSSQYNWAILVCDGASTWSVFSQTQVTFTAPTVQTFLSGTGTYTTPAGILYLKVIMAGAGGGGGGSGAGPSGGTGTTGGNTTFGTTLLVANGGVGGSSNTGAGGAGGTASLGAAIGLALSGGDGQAIVNNSTGAGNAAGAGGTTAFGGAGSGGGGSAPPSAGNNATTNTGAGGGGASQGNYSGNGGGAGGYINALLSPTLSTYAYAVGAGGAGGTAGSGGSAGGNGAAGLIIVEEYYQ